MSILNKIWKVKSPAPKKFHEKHSEYLPVMRQLFWNRGLKTKKEIEQFFNPNYDKDLHSPYLLKNIRLAVRRINSAIDKNEHILIYGDYDVDGVCGATLLKQVFEKLGATYISVYIPHRSEEGYGLNIAAIKKFTEDGVHLIVTVDCGSTNIDEIKYAQEHGIDVIVTDHHQVLDDVNFILINPHQSSDKYPFKDLSGTGVAFKLAQALIDTHRKKRTPGVLNHGWEKWLLDLVALATVADVMPLTGENRTLVKYGLLVLAKTKRHGLRALMKSAKVTPSALSSYTIGFILGPRINAAGRMEHAKLAFDLLNTDNDEVASTLALQLNEKNRERQALVADILKEIRSSDIGADSCIFEGREHWPIGVLGIVAGRLADRYNRPSFIYQKKKTVLVGSVRTPHGFNAIKILENCNEFLQRFGGHEQAGGFTADIKHETALGKALTETIINYTGPTHVSPTIEVDAKMQTNEISHDIVEQLKKFEPHGEANTKPVFLLSGVQLANIRMVGVKRNHFKCDIVSDNMQFKAIGFNFTEATALKNGDNVDILFNLEEDDWNGNSELSLKLMDVKKL